MLHCHERGGNKAATRERVECARVFAEDIRNVRQLQRTRRLIDFVNEHAEVKRERLLAVRLFTAV